MKNSDETDLWVTLLAVSTNQSIRDGGLTFSLKSSRQPQAFFQLMARTLLKAQDRGLTVLFEVTRTDSGEIQEVIFERVLTPAGVSFLEQPGPKVELSAESRALLRGALQGTPFTAKGAPSGADAPRVPKIANYTVADQLRDTTREVRERAQSGVGASQYLRGQTSD